VIPVAEMATSARANKDKDTLLSPERTGGVVTQDLPRTPIFYNESVNPYSGGSSSPRTPRHGRCNRRLFNECRTRSALRMLNQEGGGFAYQTPELEAMMMNDVRILLHVQEFQRSCGYFYNLQPGAPDDDTSMPVCCCLSNILIVQCTPKAMLINAACVLASLR
jgi:hypothetical protein